MNNKFNSFLSKRNKIENFVSLLEVASSRGISGYVFVRNILRPVLENKNWNNINQFVNIISRKLNNLNEAIIDPADPTGLGSIERRRFAPEEQAARKVKHDDLFEKVKEEFKKHIKEAQYKTGYFLRATEKYEDDPEERSKAKATIAMLDHLTKVINKYINDYKLKYKTEFTDAEYEAEVERRKRIRGDFEKAAGPIISQFTRDKIPVKHVSFAELLQKLTNARSRMTDLQKLKLSFTVDQLINDRSVNIAHKAKLRLLAANLPTPPRNKAALKDAIEADQARRRIAIAPVLGRIPSSEPSSSSTSSDPRYNPELDDMLGITTNDALDAVVNAVAEPIDDIRKTVPVEIAPEEPPASLAPPETVNPEPTVVRRDRPRAEKLAKTLTAEEKRYFDSLGTGRNVNKSRKSRFLNATPEQRREMMASGPTQRDLFSSSGMSDWTNNNIGTFKQFVERFYT